MLHCNEVTRLCASEDIRRASFGKRMAVRLHLMMCSSCQRYVRELKVIGDAVRGISREAPDDEARADALIRRVLSDTAQSDE